jgi:hypothetical protein
MGALLTALLKVGSATRVPEIPFIIETSDCNLRLAQGNSTLT